MHALMKESVNNCKHLIDIIWYFKIKKSREVWSQTALMVLVITSLKITYHKFKLIIYIILQSYIDCSANKFNFKRKLLISIKLKKIQIKLFK